MLKQLLNIDTTISEVMFVIIIVLGVIVIFKFSKYFFKNVFFRKSDNEPVFKKLIKKSNDLQPLN